MFDTAESKRFGLLGVSGSRRQAAVVDLQLQVGRVHQHDVEATGAHDVWEPVLPGPPRGSPVQRCEEAVPCSKPAATQQFAIEGLLLGLAGGVLGLAIGYGLAEMISAIGIPMPPPPGMEEGYTGEIRVTGAVLLKAFLIAFTTTALAGLYPAWKASRSHIINALRHNI